MSIRHGMNPKLSLSAIGQIALPARDLARAVACYRDVPRLPFLFEAPPGLAFFECSGVRLMLDRAAPNAGAASAVVYFRVDEIAQAHRTLGSRGVIFEDSPHLIHKFPDHELWMCFFRDTEGNGLALMSEV